MNNNNVYASYNGSQRGFTIRDFQLNQLSFVGTDFNFSGIAAGPDNDVYLTSNNHIFHYNNSGKLIRDMTFPDGGINYTSVIVKGDRVYAAYEGSQLGVTVRDLNLNQLSYFNTGVKASGIAAGPNNDVYVAAGNHIYHYKTDGTLIKDMEFPISSINYTDVTVIGERVYASYNGSQEGFTIRDLALNQLSYKNTGFNISGIAAGPNNDLYLSSANHIYNYNTDGTLIKDMTFPDNRINYTSVSVIFTTLT
ncbi:hypothetical protein H0A36_11445 [Endozoicomonas sp. SM1973]|uniref:Uncharacterized protein n=1 Tax=Spartinivicinus marinus TaxID=2994442 RepID=A0A853I982_9GAMM|nr:hypothetical protein [Spartinivicinus marinus]MCX4026141.1 hypothetical protein [Spartinivicinus marinus]NYZ66624.1 hypothetical protein [Spartinivicinus marinus]